MSRSQKPDQYPQFVQLSLFEDIQNLGTLHEANSVRVPTELANTQIAPQGLAPKIFWALVDLRDRGKKRVTGAEIAKIINQYLVDDLTKVEPTNISKALRGKALQSQPWLITEEITARKKLYGLSDCWQDHWVNYLGKTLLL